MRVNGWMVGALSLWTVALTAHAAADYQAPRMTTPPTIDGRMDEWRHQVAVTMSQPNVPDLKVETACLGWDATNLYLAVDVRDKAIVNDRPLSALQDADAVEFRLLVAGGNGVSNLWRLCLAPTCATGETALRLDRRDLHTGLSTQAAASTANHPAAGITWAVATNAHGWAIEVALPVALLGLRTDAGVALPFLLVVWDRDRTDVDEWKEWHTRSESASQKAPAAQWPHLVLVETAAAPDAPAAGALKTAALFGDNMVLQQDRTLPVWGTAAAGEVVTVTCGESTAKTTAGKDGRWRVQLAPVKSRTAQPLTMTIAGATGTLTYTNVLLGEVWICSGQSNMEFPLARATNAVQEIAAATQSAIRLFKVKNAVADKPRDDAQGQWVSVSPQTVGAFSAIGYLFARDVHQALGVPVGMIGTYWGGTPAQAWTSRDVLMADPSLAPMVQSWDARAANPADDKAKYAALLKQWQADAAKAKAKQLELPPKPNWTDPAVSPKRPANLFNAMVAPLIPFGIRGVLWYQGEANAHAPEQYATLFPALIRDWRSRWDEGDFPFYFVQLAGYHEASWPWLRESQRRTLSLPNTGMAVAIDVGDKWNIHPLNKQAVAHRLAVIALHDTYGKTEIACHGPELDTLKIDGNKARLVLRYADGLTVSGTTPPPFLIAGADRHFVPAQSKIEGDGVTVWSDALSAPVAVRYAWSSWISDGLLINRAGLPMAPFRTDDGPYEAPAALTPPAPAL